MTEDLLVLGEFIAEQAAHMDAAEHRLLANIREFDRREGWASLSSCAKWLSWRLGWSPGTAREHVRVAKALGSLPHIDEALRLGKVSYCKVRAMTRVATQANEQVLLMDAALTAGWQLERVCRKYRQLRRIVDNVNPADDDVGRYLRRRDLDNGMVSIEAVCHPEEAALIWAAIEQATMELVASRHAATRERGATLDANDGVRAASDPDAGSSAEASTVCDLEDDVPAESASASKALVDLSGESVRTHDAALDISAETYCGSGSSVALEAFPDGSAACSRVVTRSGELAAGVPAETCGGREVACDASDVAPGAHGVGDLDADDDEAAAHGVGDLDAGDDEADAHGVGDLDAGDDEADAHGPGEDCDDDDDAGDEDLAGDDAAAEFEADCAYFERFGVCPEPQREPVSRIRASRPSSRPAAIPSMTGRSPASTAASPIGTSTSAAKPVTQPQFNRIDGLLALVRKFAMGESSRTPVEIVVTVSAEALANHAPPSESFAFLDDDGCISAEAARRMSCDAGIVTLVEDEHGDPVSVGRRTRSIPSSIGRALRKRDKCCRFPGCTNQLYVDGHHVKHWALGGETALNNLVLLCGRHHKFVHEYGYRVEMDAGGQPQFFDPQGRPATDIPARISRDDLGWEHLVAANSGLGIEPHVCRWDGEPVSYNDVCHALYRLDAGLLTSTDVM